MFVSRRTGFERALVIALAVVTAPACVLGDAADKRSEGVQRVSKGLAFDIDLSQTTASGLSSGAFMAVQFQVAFSATVRGAAAFAGGPFACAQGSIASALTTCMSSSAVLDPAPFVSTTKTYAAAGAIDPIANLAAHRVFLFGGANDTTVSPAVMDGLRDYYAAVGVDPKNVAYERRRAATAHTMPTLAYGGDCAKTASPFVGKCGYDGAGEALAHLHGPLEPRSASLSGTFVTLPQADFIASPAAHSLADTGFAYVPSSCASGEPCRIHVAFHGCQQSASSPAGDAFYKHAGYNEWADSNRIIVLYPQTIATKGSNPNGCWDWWGYDSPDHAKKSGPQMEMVKAMIDHFAGAASVDAGAPPADAVAPTPIAPDPHACVLASNAEHVTAGRARAAYGLAFAKGSSQPLGTNTTFVHTALRRIAKDVYVLGVCTK